MNTYDMYKEVAVKFAKKYEVDNDHIIDIITSLMMTRDGHWSGGSFVQAVLENDLLKTINRADATCLSNLRVIVAAKEFCHMDR